MLIEFAGLPGSGKSAVARHLTAESPSIRTAGLRKLGKRDIIEHPLAVTRQFARWRALGTKWSDKRALRNILRRRISQDLVSDARSTLVLLEEGITQYIWRTLFLFPNLRTELWDPFLEVEYPLIALDADAALLRSRILTKDMRGQINQRLGGLPGESAEWDYAVNLYEEMLTHASRYRQLERVDATGDLATTVERVVLVIRALELR
jgi:adenylate kinase family enzyme